MLQSPISYEKKNEEKKRKVKLRKWPAVKCSSIKLFHLGNSKWQILMLQHWKKTERGR